MQVLFLKLIFFIPRKGMHTYSFLKMRNDVCPAVLFICFAVNLSSKKKKPLLKRILDGSRKFLTPLRLIKKWQHKIKNKGDLLGRQSKPLFLFFSAAKQFGEGKFELLRAFSP